LAEELSLGRLAYRCHDVGIERRQADATAKFANGLDICRGAKALDQVGQDHGPSCCVAHGETEALAIRHKASDLVKPLPGRDF